MKKQSRAKAKISPHFIAKLQACMRALFLWWVFSHCPTSSFFLSSPLFLLIFFWYLLFFSFFLCFLLIRSANVPLRPLSYFYSSFAWFICFSPLMIRIFFERIHFYYIYIYGSIISQEGRSSIVIFWNQLLIDN